MTDDLSMSGRPIQVLVYYGSNGEGILLEDSLCEARRYDMPQKTKIMNNAHLV